MDFKCEKCGAGYAIPDWYLPLTEERFDEIGLPEKVLAARLDEFQSPDAQEPMKIVRDGMWQVLGGYDLEITYHECIYSPPNFPGPLGVPAAPLTPRNDRETAG